MAGESLAASDPDREPVRSAIDIAREQSWTIRIALASPTIPGDVKSLLLETAATKRHRLEEAGEYEAAVYYDLASTPPLPLRASDGSLR
jgi:hypothetical protein